MTEGLLTPAKPISEHIGSIELTIPERDSRQEIRAKILNDIFDLTKDYILHKVEQGNTRIKIYRNTKFQFVYHHYNPSFGERELRIDFADAERQETSGVYFIAMWSPWRNSFYVSLINPDPKFAGLRYAILVTEDKLKLIKETVEQFEKILNTVKREEEAHQFLKNNGVILGLTSTIEPISKFKLGDDYVIDFVIKEIPDGYVLIEIERPQMKLFKKTKKTTPPERTQELNHAIEQIEHWKAWIGKNHSYISTKLEEISPSPVCWLIAGKKANLSTEEKRRLAQINEEYKGAYKIFTYEDLIDRVKAVIGRIG